MVTWDKTEGPETMLTEKEAKWKGDEHLVFCQGKQRAMGDGGGGDSEDLF